MATETEVRFDAYINQGYYLIDKQKFDIAFAKEVMAICENLQLRYEEIRKSRDKWKKKYYDSQASKTEKTQSHENQNDSHPIKPVANLDGNVEIVRPGIPEVGLNSSSYKKGDTNTKQESYKI